MVQGILLKPDNKLKMINKAGREIKLKYMIWKPTELLHSGLPTINDLRSYISHKNINTARTLDWTKGKQRNDI